MNRYILTEDEELNVRLEINNEKDIEGVDLDGYEYVGRTLDELETAWLKNDEPELNPLKDQVLRLIRRQRIIENNTN